MSEVALNLPSQKRWSGWRQPSRSLIAEQVK
jgi:hypothetical protein